MNAILPTTRRGPRILRLAAALCALLLPSACATHVVPPAAAAARASGGVVATAAFAPLAPRVDAVFADFDRSDSPGCALGVYRDGAIAYARGYGMAHLEHGVPITPRTIFDIGSTSKQFAAAALALLEQDGVLSIDDDVRRFVPELPTYDRPITIRQLLTHTSGLRDYIGILTLGGARYDDVLTVEDALGAVVRQRALNFAPGDEYLYSNSGFFLLSVIVERVTGMTLRDFARARIFDPLGMQRSHFLGSYDDVVADRAAAYSPRRTGELVSGAGAWRLDLPRWLQTGDGSVFTSVEELLLWDRNFYTPTLGGRAFLDAMHTRGVLTGGDTLGYALGLQLGRYRGEPVVAHGGSWGGYRAELLRFPEHRTSVAVLCNAGSAPASLLARRVADVVLGASFTEPAPAPQAGATGGAPASPPAAVTLSAAQRAGFAGLYYSPEVEATYRIVAEGDELRLHRRNSPPATLTPVSATELRAGALQLRFGEGARDGFALDIGRVRNIRFERTGGSTLIRGATLIDGTGAPRRIADVRVRGDRIVDVGDLSTETGEHVIAASGLVLAPGFIDTHSHAGRDIFDHPDALGAVSQGITTIIEGQDGGSIFPLADFFARLDAAPPAVNAASYAGHGTIRRRVMGDDFRRHATTAEVERMRALLRAELAAGALGLSTGLEYDPGIYSATDEVITLARETAAVGGRYISHVRSEDREFWQAIDEIIRIGREAQIPVQVSHTKLAMRSEWGKADQLIARFDAARAAGVELTADIYPYTYWQSTLTVLFPQRDFEDREQAELVLREIAAPEGLLLGRFEPQPEYVGRTVADISMMRGTDPATTLMALIAEALEHEARTGRGGESVIGTSMSEADIERLMTWRYMNIASDGSLAGRHPRGFGTYTRVLGRYVRERGVLELEDAIRRMTSLAAANVGIRERGTIAPGVYADLVLFDPETVIDRATPQDPHAVSEGIARVWVNGVVVYVNGSTTGERPGRVLRRQPTD
jgi:N-acyl-D-amino-acid deacylase